MKLVALIRMALFGRPTVRGVMSAFNKTLAELKQVEGIHEAEAQRQKEVADRANAARVAAQSEAEEARLVADQFSRLVKVSRPHQPINTLA